MGRENLKQLSGYSFTVQVNWQARERKISLENKFTFAEIVREAEVYSQHEEDLHVEKIFTYRFGHKLDKEVRAILVKIRSHVIPR